MTSSYLLEVPDQRTVMESIQGEVDYAIEWGKQRGLSFNPTKTQCILFSRRYRSTLLKSPPLTKVNSNSIPLSKTVTYLGVTLHHRLNWTPHITRVAKKAKTALMTAARCVGKKWGLSPKMALWAYEVCCRPKITYAAHIWQPYISKTHKKLLESVQRLGLLLVTSTTRASPTAALEIICDAPPLDLYLQQMATQTYLRILPILETSPSNFPLKGHLWYLNNNFLSIHQSPISDLVPYCPAPPQDTFLPPLPCVTHPPNPIHPGIICYTDGSKMDQNVGYGWAITAGNQVIDENYGRLDPTHTVFQAELVALNEVASFLANNLETYNKYPSLITFLCDSKAAIDAIRSHKNNSDIAQKCVLSLEKLKSLGYRVVLDWVKGHNDTTGNEYADYLARLGGQSPLAPSYTPRLPYVLLKSKIKEKIATLWQARWSSRKDCRQSKYALPMISTCSKTGLIDLDRMKLKCACSLLTGHGPFLYHLTNLKIATSDTCRLCLEGIEDAYHLINFCPSLEASRVLFCDIDPPFNTTNSDLLTVILELIKVPKLYSLLSNKLPII